MRDKKKSLWIIFALSMFIPGLAEDSVGVNKSKQIEGMPSYEQILGVDLTTKRTTRVQIIVKNRDEIFQNHRLTIGPKGVVDGEYRGAVQWGCELPSKTQDSDLEVHLLVQRFAGKGSPVSYHIKSKTSESNVGFCYKEGA